MELSSKYRCLHQIPSACVHCDNLLFLAIAIQFPKKNITVKNLVVCLYPSIRFILKHNHIEVCLNIEICTNYHYIEIAQLHSIIVKANRDLDKRIRKARKSFGIVTMVARIVVLEPVSYTHLDVYKRQQQWN